MILTGLGISWPDLCRYWMQCHELALKPSFFSSYFHGVFVYANPCLVCLVCPRPFMIYFVRLYFIFLTVIFYNFLRKPWLISTIQFNFFGMKHAAWYKLMSLSFVFSASVWLLVSMVSCFWLFSVLPFHCVFFSVIIFESVGLFFFWFWRSSQSVATIILWHGSC